MCLTIVDFYNGMIMKLLCLLVVFFAVALDNVALASKLISGQQKPVQASKIVIDILGYKRFALAKFRPCELDFDFDSQPDISVCASQCRRLPKCSGFTWNKLQSTCHLYAPESDCPDYVDVNGDGEVLLQQQPESVRNISEEYFYSKELPIDVGAKKLPKQIGTDLANEACSIGNEDNDFLTIFLLNLAASTSQSDYPLDLYVATSTPVVPVSFELSIDSPAFDENNSSLSTFPPMQITIKEGMASRVIISKEFDLPSKGNQVSSTAIRIRSIDPQNASLVVSGLSRDQRSVGGYLNLPIKALGPAYVAITWKSDNQWSNHLGIAAYLDETIVTVQLPNKSQSVSSTSPNEISIYYNERYFHNGEAFTVRLQANEAVQLSDLKSDADLTGTRLSGNKPIAVFSGNSRSKVSSAKSFVQSNRLIEQLLPVNQWGRRFIFASSPRTGPESSGDLLKFVAAEHDTYVKIYVKNSQLLTFALESGHFGETKIPPGQCVYIEASKPILLASFSLNADSSDLSMAIIPAVEHYRSRYSFAVPDQSDYRQYVAIFGQTSGFGDVKIDGTFPQLSGVVESANAAYSCAYARLKRGAHVVEGNPNQNFSGIIYGANDRESFAYPIGFTFKAICPPPTAAKPRPKSVPPPMTNNLTAMVPAPWPCICPPGHIPANVYSFDDKGQWQCRCLQHTATKSHIRTPKKNYHRIGEQKFHQPVQVNEVYSFQGCHDDRTQLKCRQGSLIKILSANFGRIGFVNEFACGVGNSFGGQTVAPIDCGFQDAYSAVQMLCDDNEQCNFLVDQNRLLPKAASKCPVKGLYLLTYYACIDKSRLNVLKLASRNPPTSPANWRATSSATPEKSPFEARFGASTESWCASYCDETEPFLQVDLNGVFHISSYVIQGSRKANTFVKSFGLSYSSDGASFDEIRDDANGDWIHFPGNSDNLNVTWYELGVRVIARYVRIHVIEFQGHPCLHIDFMRSNVQLTCPPISVENSNIFNETGLRGTKLEVQCNNGYFVNSQIGLETYSLTCTLLGVWEGDLKTCKLPARATPLSLKSLTRQIATKTSPKNCGDIPRVWGALHNGRNSKINSKVTYRCIELNDGKTRLMLGNPEIKCRENGRWTVPPECLEISRELRQEVFDFEN